MIDPQNGVWLLPTRGRPDKLRQFFEAYNATGATTPGMALIDSPDMRSYLDITDLPKGWVKQLVRGGCIVDAMNEAMRIWEDRNSGRKPDWIGYIADDNIPETPEWDTKLIGRLKGWNVINSNDGWQARQDINVGRMHGAVAWSGELVRAVGYLWPAGLKHMFTESVWEAIGRSTGCWQTDMSVMVRHAHAILTGDSDQTHEHTEAFFAHDEAVFHEWLNTEKGTAVDRVLRLMDEYGSKIALPDLKKIRLMMATPSGDGRYERGYMKAWHQTICLLKDCGADVEWIEMPYCADLALARAKLVGTFWRSSFTHLMMIDDDMAWQPRDVVRLLQCGKDFVAAAGPMRKFPLTFCVNFPDHGTFTHGSGEMEAEKVGGAFVLLSRACIVRMISAYPQLEFVTNDDAPADYALFDPVYVKIEGKTWRFSEDYSFCRRWKDIGGKIYVLPDVRLDHSGHHTFSGALTDIMHKPNEAEKGAA